MFFIKTRLSLGGDGMQKKLFSGVTIAAKLALSGGLLALVLHDRNFNDIAQVIARANYTSLIAAFSLTIIVLTIVSWRWRIILHEIQVSVPFRLLARTCLIAYFFNNILPSTIGGDYIRARNVYLLSKNKLAAALSVLTDRLIGTLVLCGFAVIGLYLLQPQANSIVANIQKISYTIIAIAVIICAVGYRLIVSYNYNNKSTNYPRMKKLAKIVVCLLELPWKTKLKLLMLSLLIQLLVISYYYLIAQALNLPLTMADMLCIVPLSLFVLLLPITINGIGLREGIFIILLSLYGIDKIDAISLAWIDFCIKLVIGLIGGLVYIMKPVAERIVNPSPATQKQGVLE